MRSLRYSETREKDGDDCEKPIKCANCDERHYSTDKTCEAFRLQKEIKTRIAISNITFWVAKNKISGVGATRAQKNKRPFTQPLPGYDKGAHRKLLTPDAIPMKKPVYFTRNRREGTENGNTNNKSQLCRKSGPQAHAMKGIEEVDELIKRTT
ncbi:hypothetical protein QE152_g26020 [Popillia japonica]|uniref:Uncharacterized protein n=1 Tax=Popillia japonica TaxID=7064 RepID=A0AAW1JZ33_POPJA